MMQNAAPKHDTLRTAVEITSSVCRLPAVATLDWLDRAAGMLRPIAAPSRICLLIVHAGRDGRGVTLEAAGYAGPTGLRLNGATGGPDEASVELTVRSRAERITELGFETPDQPMLGTLQSVLGGGDWRTRGLGTLWQGVPASEVLIAAEPLGDTEPGRILVTLVALAESGAEAKPGELDLLGVINPLLVNRALVAIGSARATSSRWLTAREQEVLDLLVVGKSVRVIAEELQRSPHTVHDHVKSLHRKLHASSRGELVAKALGHSPLTTAETGTDQTATPSQTTELKPEEIAEVRTTTAATRLRATPAGENNPSRADRGIGIESTQG